MFIPLIAMVLVSCKTETSSTDLAAVSPPAGSWRFDLPVGKIASMKVTHYKPTGGHHRVVLFGDGQQHNFLVQTPGEQVKVGPYDHPAYFNFTAFGQKPGGGATRYPIALADISRIGSGWIITLENNQMVAVITVKDA